MANLFTLGFGKVSDLMGKLAEAGLTAEMAEEVRKNPALAEAIVKALKSKSTFTFVHGLFVKPEAQIKKVREWNGRFVWGLPEEAFVAAEKSVPEWPETQLVAVVLVPYLYDKTDDNESVTSGLERTFHELWKCAMSRQKTSWRWDGYRKAGPDRLRLLKGIEHKFGLRWEVIDLGSLRNKKPCDVRSAESSPHAGILAAAALHPRWVKSMDGDKVPFVWMPGYEVSVPGMEPWKATPRLSGCGSKVDLGCNSGIDGSLPWAVPSYFQE